MENHTKQQFWNNMPKLPILEKTKQYVSGGIVMEPKMVQKPAFLLAGFAIKTTTKDGENLKAIPRFWSDVMSDGRMEKLHKEAFLKSHDEYGACFPENHENGEFEYVLGVEVAEGCAISEEYHICTIPEALYAVFSSPPANGSNFVSSIQGTWRYIFSEWLPTSGYAFADNGVDFEFYDDRCMTETEKVCDMYIPVCKKMF
ncbi:MAG: GyrI-like domain-containing protein [Treponema sp.]|jgi:AraC family transcriptional regulator|nr:GyrI-like domain-containing protein [Treponema sp.]